LAINNMRNKYQKVDTAHYPDFIFPTLV
jgi:hypothetical protein